MYLSYLLGIFLAMNMGASGIAPSFSVSYGARAIAFKFIPFLFGAMVFAGALLAGSQTSKTLGTGIVGGEFITPTSIAIVLVSVSLSLLIANISGIPQSTSQSTVFSLSALALFNGELSSPKLFVDILPTWFILPIASFVLSYILSKYIFTAPFIDRLKQFSVFRKPIFIDIVLIIVSMYVAFSIGSNNVANAAGPITTLVANTTAAISDQDISKILFLNLAILSPFFGFGAYFLGRKVLKNTGTELYLFGKGDAIIIAFISASLLVFASLCRGIPTSLVQLNVGAIFGVGVARSGYKNIVNRTHVKRFVCMWTISPVVAFFLTLLLLFLTKQFCIIL